ncbi:pentapeptide repeat-containing protein [Lactococcus lactis]|uniref:pentapeptide repeat-containing protein n=1 Tax=Lactococcus lactis TaxID=1358 RepID=UPI0033995E10
MVNKKDYEYIHLSSAEYFRGTFSQISLGQSLIENSKFQECDCKKLGMKNAELKLTNFFQCEMMDCYMRHATFENCEIIGCKFINCNLEKAIFFNSSFKYVVFENCLLNVDEIIKSAPKEANLKLGFFREIYKNELQMGHSDMYDKLLFLIRETEAELFKSIFVSREVYFKNKYKHKKKVRLSYGIKFVGLKFSKYLWGYGLKLWRILISFVALSFIFSFFYYLESNFTINQGIEYSIQNLLLSNLNDSSLQVTNSLRWTGYFQNFCSIVYIAVLTSSFYRKIAR